MFQREAAGTVDLAEYADLVAADLAQGDIDLRLLDETTVLEGVRDRLFGHGDVLSTDLYRPDQRVGDRSAFGHAGVQCQVGVLEHLYADRVAGAEQVVLRSARGAHRGSGCSNGGDGQREPGDSAGETGKV